MGRKRRSGAFYGLIALAIAMVLGAVAGSMTGMRADSSAISMAVVGALLGGFVGVVILLQFLQLSLVAKRLGGALAGIVFAIGAGSVMSWAAITIGGVAFAGAVIGAFGDRWARHATF